MNRIEPYCYRPQSFYGDTRKNISKTYAYTQEEAEPVLMQAVRYHMWRDPGLEVSGREPKCEVAQKVLRSTGTLPVGMSPKRWSAECAGGADAPSGKVRPRRKRARGREEEPDSGDGTPGQYTRWAGLG